MDKKNCCNCGHSKKDEKLAEIFSKYEQDKSNLIQILNEVQEGYGYISENNQREIAEYLGMEMAEVYGVITFYSRFTLEPKGKYNVAICLGTACFVKGSEKLVDAAKEKLGIDVGETTEDRKIFTRSNKMYWSLWTSTSIYCK